MRIVYAANIRLPTERAHGLQIMEMCRAFAQEGHEVRLVVPKRRNDIKATPWEHYGMEPSFEIVEVPMFDLIPFDRVLGRVALWLNMFWFSQAAKRAVRAFAPDVVYARDPWFAGLDPRARYIYEAHDFPARVTPLHRRFWNRTSRIVAVTESLRTAFVSAGVPEAKTLSAHDGVDVAKFEVSETKAEAREKLGLPAENFIAVYTGHLYPYKGADDLLEASAHLRPATRVIFVGGRPDDLARLKARAEALGAKNATFVGPVPHALIPRYLRAADVAVLPTRASDRHAAEFLSPLKLFEYLAAGKAIVATATPSVREVLDDRSAVLVPPSDSVALAAALNDLADVPARREALEREASSLAQGSSWANRAKRVLHGIQEPHPAQTWYRKHRTELAIVGLAFLIRFVYVTVFPQVTLLAGDALIYLQYADWMRGAIAWQESMHPYFQPGYPIFLVPIRALFGMDVFWVRFVQTAVSAATVWAMMCFAASAVSARVARVAGLIGAFYVPMILESGVLYTETLYAFLLTVGAWLTYRAMIHPRASSALAAGTAMAAAGSVRELGFYVAVLFAAALLVSKRSLKLTAAFIMPVAIVVMCVSWMNHEASKTYTTHTAPLIAKRYEKTLQDPESQKLLLAPERWKLYPEGVVRFFRLPHRLPEVSSNVSVKGVILSGDANAIWRVKEEILAKSALILYHWLLLGLAAYGIFRGKVRKEALALMLISIAFALVSIVIGSVARLQGFAAFEPMARYRFPVEPLILIAAAAGAVRFSDARSRRRIEGSSD